MSNGVSPLTAKVVLIRADFLQYGYYTMTLNKNSAQKKVKMIALGEEHRKWYLAA